MHIVLNAHGLTIQLPGLGSQQILNVATQFFSELYKCMTHSIVLAVGHIALLPAPLYCGRVV